MHAVHNTFVIFLTTMTGTSLSPQGFAVLKKRVIKCPHKSKWVMKTVPV